MSQEKIKIEQLWKDVEFTPNDNQKEAILHTKGPLFLTAGPGSGKTRVLLWRTLNLIVFHDVKPEKEKGARVQFATHVCRNCDTRYSCSSYREYVKQSGAKSFADMRKFMDDSGDDDSNAEGIMLNLEKMGEGE